MTYYKSPLLVTLCMLSPLSQALETTLAVGTSVSHTDNSNLSSTNEQDELETAVYVDATALHTGASVTMDMAYNVEHVMYDKDTQEDETITVGDGLLEWRQIPNTLTWRVTNSVRDVLRDKTLANTQANRDGRSITTASGDYTIRPGQANIVTFSGSYTDARYDDTNAQDSERVGGGIDFARALTPVSTASLRLNYNDVTFDNSASDYEYYNAALSYNAQLSRLTYQIELGYNEQKLQNNQKVDGTSIDIQADYNSGGSNWSLALLQRLTDTSVGNFNQSISGLNNSANTTTSSVYEQRSAELIYSNTVFCQSCTWNVRGLYEQQRYEFVGADDNNESAFSTSLGYAITRNVGISGSVEYRDVVFVGSSSLIDFYVVTYQLNCGIALGSRLSMSASVGYEERTSEDNISDYEELRGGIALNYQIR